MANKFIKKYWIEVILGTLFIGVSLYLNSQFLDGSNINTFIAGHDEYIAVKEVYSIIAPASFKHFVMAIISGNALYYGRIMFYLDALVAYVPYLIFGVKGMVFTVRMTHSFVMLIALILLGKTFIKNQVLKASFYSISLFTYYSMYFTMMPKPEPWQLLFLAIFFIKFYKSNYQLGPYFIYLGIAYGLKFNVILLLPLIFGLFLYTNKDSKFFELSKRLAFSLMYFLMGLMIAIPCLVLSPVKPIFLKTYIHETFEGTQKGYDDSNVDIVSWMNQGLGGNYFGNAWVSYIFILLAIIFLFRNFHKNKKVKRYESALFIVSGIILILVIMLKTKRLWPHYLWTGYIFVFLGMMMTVSRENFKRQFEFITSIVLSCFVITQFVFNSLPLFLNFNEQDTVLNNRKSSINALNYLKVKYKGARIGTDATLMYPFEDFTGVDIYHPFKGKIEDRSETKFYWYHDNPSKIWEDSNQVAVFYLRHPPRMLVEKPNVYVGMHDSLNNLFNHKLKIEFVKDTVINEVYIYKRK